MVNGRTQKTLKNSTTDTIFTQQTLNRSTVPFFDIQCLRLGLFQQIVILAYGN